MGDLRLYAIGIDEVRDTFGAEPGLRDHLRQLADRAFAPPPVPQPAGLLGKLGPLFKRAPDAPVIRPDQPVPADFDALVNGHWISPDRLAPTWRLFEQLVSGRAWDHLQLRVDEAMVNRLDFELTRAGSPSSLGIAAFLHSDARTGMTPMPGTTVCYRMHPHVVATTDAFTQAMGQVPTEGVRDQVRVLVNWLNGFPHWGDLAPGMGRPQPDLIGFWNSGTPPR